MPQAKFTSNINCKANQTLSASYTAELRGSFFFCDLEEQKHQHPRIYSYNQGWKLFFISG
jgi:hypothetical protein